MKILRGTVHELFAGENADHIVRCAEDMAWVIHSKMHDIPNPRFDPAQLTPEQKERYASYRETHKNAMSFSACRHAKRKPRKLSNPLVWLGNEPYRLFFLSGILFGIAGVLLWPLFLLHLAGGICHMRGMTARGDRLFLLLLLSFAGALGIRMVFKLGSSPPFWNRLPLHSGSSRPSKGVKCQK